MHHLSEDQPLSGGFKKLNNSKSLVEPFYLKSGSRRPPDSDTGDKKAISPFVDNRCKGRHIEALYVLGRSEFIATHSLKLPDRQITSDLIYDSKSNCLSIVQSIDFYDAQFQSIRTLIDTQDFKYGDSLQFQVGFRTSYGIFQPVGFAKLNDGKLSIQINDSIPQNIEFNVEHQSGALWIKKPVISTNTNPRQDQTKSHTIKKIRVAKELPKDSINFQADEESDFNEEDFARLRGEMPINSSTGKRTIKQNRQSYSSPQRW